MIPVTFPESNCVYAADQPEYQPLPVLKLPDGMCVSCWKLTLWERIKLLFTGKVWLMQLTFNQPLQPILPSVGRPFDTIAETTV